MQLSQTFWCFLVAVVWGVTNPLMKIGTSGIERVQGTNWISKVLLELKYLALNWKYSVPFVLNQLGSLLYYWTLSTANLSIAVPLTNSLTLVIATVIGKALGEPTGGLYLYLGVVLILSGVLVSSY